MRKTFQSCSYVKEGHYRKDWSTSNGDRYDTVKYGILREDWASGTLTAVQWTTSLSPQTSVGLIKTLDIKKFGARIFWRQSSFSHFMFFDKEPELT